jgi:hypothetical protein
MQFHAIVAESSNLLILGNDRQQLRGVVKVYD